MSTLFYSDSYMGRSSGLMPPRPTYCPACRTEHDCPVAWTVNDPCPSKEPRMRRIQTPNNTERVETRSAGMPTALCMDESCPWKHVGPSGVTDNKAHEHVMDSGHAVRVYPPQMDFLPVATNQERVCVDCEQKPPAVGSERCTNCHADALDKEQN